MFTVLLLPAASLIVMGILTLPKAVNAALVLTETDKLLPDGVTVAVIPVGSAPRLAVAMGSENVMLLDSV